MQQAVKSDARLFRDFGGASAKGLKGMAKYKASGMPRLFGNKATRSLMRRTKFWAGFLDWLGVANFVGPEELKAQMGSEFEKKMGEYSNTSEAEQNWNDEFGDVQNEPEVQQTQDTETQSMTSKTQDITKNIVKDLIFGPITGSIV
jgi:hypothetical protein